MTALLTDFFIVQGVILDASLLFVAVVITWGFIIGAREKRCEQRERVARTIAQAETIMCETRSRQ